jgi:hypothetical protein
MDQAEFDSRVSDYRTPGGKHYESFSKGFKDAPELKQAFDDLYKARYGQEEPAKATEPPKPKEIELSPEDPPKCDSTSPGEAVAEEELKQRWGDKFEDNFKAALEARDFVFPPGDKEADGFFDRLPAKVLNDPDLIEILVKARSRLPNSSAPVSLAGMSPKKIEQTAVRTILALGITKRVAQEIAQHWGDGPEVTAFIAKIGLRMYGREEK